MGTNNIIQSMGCAFPGSQFPQGGWRKVTLHVKTQWVALLSNSKLRELKSYVMGVSLPDLCLREKHDLYWNSTKQTRPLSWKRDMISTSGTKAVSTSGHKTCSIMRDPWIKVFQYCSSQKTRRLCPRWFIN